MNPLYATEGLRRALGADHTHAERRAEARHFPADRTQAQDAHGLAAQSADPLVLPDAPGLLLEPGGQALLEGQHHRERELAHVSAVDSACVGNAHARGEIGRGKQPVEAGTRHLQQPEALRSGPVSARWSVGDQDFGVGQARYELLLAPPADELAVGPERPDRICEQLGSEVVDVHAPVHASMIVCSALIQTTSTPGHTGRARWREHRRLR